MIPSACIRSRRLLLFLIGCIFADPWLAGDTPLYVAKAKSARTYVVIEAETYLGSPYRYGGTERSGFDCSGLVFRVYAEALGLSTPRTVAGLHALAEPLARKDLQPGDLLFFNTTGPLAHVGIYAGAGRFIHAASDGLSTGVIYSTLEEPYWSRGYAGSGRLIPPAEYLGLIVQASLGPSLGPGLELRGFSAEIGFSYRVGESLELGLAARPEYDAALGIGRLPFALTLALDRKLRFFAGPALTIGTPGLESDAINRDYLPAGGLLASVGVSWSPWSLPIMGLDWALAGELVYNRYIPAEGEEEDFLADQRMRLRAGIVLRARWEI